MGLPSWRVRGALRVSVGPSTAPEEIDKFLAALGRVAARLRVSDRGHKGPRVGNPALELPEGIDIL